MDKVALIDEVTNQIAKDFASEDLTAVCELLDRIPVEVLRGYLPEEIGEKYKELREEIFDAAQWSRSDILSQIEDSYNMEDVEQVGADFIVDVVIQSLNDRFDANDGINWDIINYNIADVMEENNVRKK